MAAVLPCFFENSCYLLSEVKTGTSSDRQMDLMRRRSALAKLRRFPRLFPNRWASERFNEAGIHRTYVSDIERGVRNPTILVVEKLAGALDVSASQLLDDPLPGQ